MFRRLIMAAASNFKAKVVTMEQAKPPLNKNRLVDSKSTPSYRTSSLTKEMATLSLNNTHNLYSQKRFSSNGKSLKYLSDVAKLISDQKVKNVVVVAGAGISTPSGIPDFRTPGTGIYDNISQYRIPYPEAIFDIDYFFRNPKPFFALAKELYPSGKYQPNYIHYFVRLLETKGLLLRMYTQNIDGLERLAGISRSKLVEAHGTFATATCTFCGQKYNGHDIKEKIFTDILPRCTRIGCMGTIKPDIVFFGEDLPKRFYNYKTDMMNSDMVLVMGTSLEVYPFAGIIDNVRWNVPRILFNRESVGPFSYNKRTRDLVAEGDLLQTVQKFVNMIGWNEDMTELLKAREVDKNTSSVRRDIQNVTYVPEYSTSGTVKCRLDRASAPPVMQRKESSVSGVKNNNATYRWRQNSGSFIRRTAYSSSSTEDSSSSSESESSESETSDSDEDENDTKKQNGRMGNRGTKTEVPSRKFSTISHPKNDRYNNSRRMKPPLGKWMLNESKDTDNLVKVQNTKLQKSDTTSKEKLNEVESHKSLVANKRKSLKPLRTNSGKSSNSEQDRKVRSQEQNILVQRKISSKQTETQNSDVHGDVVHTRSRRNGEQETQAEETDFYEKENLLRRLNSQKKEASALKKIFRTEKENSLTEIQLQTNGTRPSKKILPEESPFTDAVSSKQTKPAEHSQLISKIPKELPAIRPPRVDKSSKEKYLSKKSVFNMSRKSLLHQGTSGLSNSTRNTPVRDLSTPKVYQRIGSAEMPRLQTREKQQGSSFSDTNCSDKKQHHSEGL